MSLYFETALPLAPASPNRTDVACFIGFVARRSGVPLPATVREELRTAGWVQGPWHQGEDALQSLENLPVTVESWEAFARLFAWEERPLKTEQVTDARAACTTYMGAAVRSFFARGGKRAVIVRVGNPWPYLESSVRRTVRRRERLVRLVPDFADRSMPAHPFDPTEPRSWRGIYHLYGLREVSLLCLPDLPDACAVEPTPPAISLPPPVLPEGFVECSQDEPAPPQDRGLRLIPAPRLDSRSFAPWRLAVASVCAFLARHQREAILVAALPLPHLEARRVLGGGWVHAESDMLGFLRRAGVIESAVSREGVDPVPHGAFVQLAYPWLCTRAGTDLPEGAEPPDGLLAGLMAANALTRGTFNSVAGRFSVPLLNDVHSTVPPVSWGAGPDSPSEQLAERVCLFAPTPDGITLHSDVTASPEPASRFGGARRLMGALMRAARITGESVLFDGNGPALWARVRHSIEDLLEAFWRQGALVGSAAADAFSVRCDRSTMTQNDIDNGRMLVEISVRPAASIERITVVLNLASTGAGAGSLREVA
ncbi:MAG: phage tail sheath family protein [Burkholderiales bacterium]|nr:phage tail sheath family protein [Burkholderiales bacterium]